MYSNSFSLFLLSVAGVTLALLAYRVQMKRALSSMAQQLRVTIERGRSIPQLDAFEHAAWTTSYGNCTIAWEHLSITSEIEPSPNQRLPIIVARPASTTTAVPVVIVMHGTSRAKSEPAIRKAMARYASKGWATLTFDSRYHGERSGKMTGDFERSGRWVDELSKADREGRYQQSLVEAWSGSGERPFIYDSVWDLMRAIDYIDSRKRDFDISRIGSTGISLGGMITWVGAVVDSRIKVAAPAIGVQGFRWAVENNSFMARVNSIRPVFDHARVALGRSANDPTIDAEVVQSVWDRIIPGLSDEYDAPRSLPLIAPRPLLLVQGAKDPRCPIEGVQEALAATQDAYSAFPGSEANLELFVDESAAHEITEKMWNRIESWFDEHL